MFRGLQEYTITTLKRRFDVRELPVEPQFAHKVGMVRGVPLTMTNIAFETDTLRKVRITYMDAGDAVQILTTMAFPRPSTDLPIFGADMLGFRGQPHLIVIDHQPLYLDNAAYIERYGTPLKDIHARYAHLPRKDRELPAWTAEFFSPYTHYSRPTLDDLPDVLAAYQDYWDCYLDQVAAATPLPIEAHQRIWERQAAYCHNHIENEQAEGMLQKLFGEDYCHAFINTFLFDIHIEEQQPS